MNTATRLLDETHRPSAQPTDVPTMTVIDRTTATTKTGSPGRPEQPAPSAPTLSFEFYPPRSEASERALWRTLGSLETLKPAWFSMTYGALGSGADASVDVVSKLAGDKTIQLAAHLTCGGRTRAEVGAMLQRFADMGVKRLVALRGDAANELLDGAGEQAVMRYATDLVRLAAETTDMDISVAAYPEVHPEAPSAEADLQHLKEKLDAGASRALTQFFFDPDVFLRWRDRAVAIGIDKPLVPGILPIHDIDKVAGFAAKCGADVPNALRERFTAAAGDADALHRMGVEQCVELCEHLMSEGVDAFHFYTLNRSDFCLPVGKVLTGMTIGVIRD